MLLKSTRVLKEMGPVLADPNINDESDSSKPIYWVFSNVSKLWENMTVISPGSINKEFNKTFGHYHSSPVTEKYKLISGKGILLLQKRKFADDDWINDQIEKIYFVEFVPGDEIDISQEWGHSWSNIGSDPLVTLDNWKEGHVPDDYTPVEKMGGLGYFLMQKDGGANFVPNPKYKDLPKPEWLSARDFNKLSDL